MSVCLFVDLESMSQTMFRQELSILKTQEILWKLKPFDLFHSFYTKG